MADLLNSEQSNLFSKVARRLLNRVLTRCLIKEGEFTGKYHHEHIKSQREAISALESGGIFCQTDDKMWVLLVDPADLPAKIDDIARSANLMRLEAVIKAFVDLSSEFPTDEHPEVPLTRRPFPLPDTYLDIFSGLEKCGYVGRTPDGWVWSDLMIPLMVAFQVWHPDGFSIHDRWEEDPEWMDR